LVLRRSDIYARISSVGIGGRGVRVGGTLVLVAVGEGISVNLFVLEGMDVVVCKGAGLAGDVSASSIFVA
jgi:hypothetical protein